VTEPLRPTHRGFLAHIIDDEMAADGLAWAWWSGRCMCGWSGERWSDRGLAEDDMINHLVSVNWKPYMVDVELPPFPQP
jgi:hypothetical protein